MRLFIAIPFPIEKRHKLETKLNSEKKYIEKNVYGKIKWVEPQNWHITLKFLGDIKVSDYQRLVKHLTEFLKNRQQFGVKFFHILLWPKKQPRIILYQPEKNKELQELSDKLSHLIDSNDFVEVKLRGTKPPHLTLARIKGKWLGSAYESKLENKFTVKQITLFQSELTSQGPIYTELENFNLK